jgi:hypothetical protein
LSWTIKFTEKNTLPGTKGERSSLYENMFTAANYCALAVGVGIALAMPIAGTMDRHQFGKD